MVTTMSRFQSLRAGIVVLCVAMVFGLVLVSAALDAVQA
jgi:hypothetical protein